MMDDSPLARINEKRGVKGCKEEVRKVENRKEWKKRKVKGKRVAYLDGQTRLEQSQGTMEVE